MDMVFVLSWAVIKALTFISLNLVVSMCLCVSVWKQIEVKIRKPLVTVFKLGNSNANPICKAHHVSTYPSHFTGLVDVHIFFGIPCLLCVIYFFKVVIFRTNRHEITKWIALLLDDVVVGWFSFIVVVLCVKLELPLFSFRIISFKQEEKYICSFGSASKSLSNSINCQAIAYKPKRSIDWFAISRVAFSSMHKITIDMWGTSISSQQNTEKHKMSISGILLFII